MRLPALFAAAALAALPVAAFAQQSPVPVVAPTSAVLTVTAEGKSTRTPDIANFTAGVTTQAASASAALSDNASRMSAVIAALKKAGVADRDIQTSNLSVNPVYAQSTRQPDGSYQQEAPRIIAYQATNNVSVRQRDLKNFGKVIDTLVSSGANQVNGPSFTLDNSDAALDEARVDAMAKARARAQLYAKAAGLRVVRILSISESGGYYQPQPVMYARAEVASAAAPPPSPVAPGELALQTNVTVLFELAP